MSIKQELKMLKQFNKRFYTIFNSHDSLHDIELEADIVMEELRRATFKMVDANHQPVHHFFYREAVNLDLYSTNHDHLTYRQVHQMLDTLSKKIQHPDMGVQLMRESGQTDWSVVEKK